MTEVVTCTFIAIGVTMVVFAVLQLTARKKAPTNYWLGLLFFSFGYVWLYFGLYRATRFVWAPWLLYSDVFVTFLVGPLMYLYARSLSGNAGTRIVVLRFLSFLPGLGVLGYLFVARPSYVVSPLSLPGPDPAYSAIPAVDLLNTIGDAYFFCFVVVSTIIVIKLFRAGNTEFRRAFRGVLVYFVVGLSTFVLYFAGHILDSDALLALATLANGVNSTYFFFWSYRHPEYSQRMVRSRTDRLRSAAGSYRIDVPRILAHLAEVMESNQGYRNPNITLQSLSIQLGIQHHQLSQILNSSQGMSFRAYVNQRRLEEAKRLLRTKPDMSILEIAFAVGFNSKSAFNLAFSRDTGLSPTEFKKKTR